MIKKSHTLRKTWQPAHLLVLSLSILCFINSGCSRTKGDLQVVSADSSKGFNFPYVLFIPEEGLKKKITFVVEANNTGHTSDDLDDHKEGAFQQARNDGYLGNFLAHQLQYPLLIPIFPRPEENWQIYTHALDRDAMLEKNSAIARLDAQLLAMFEHAKGTLAAQGYTVDEKFMLTGFSASGTFANRFTAIHPQRVKACAVGGVNGILILPADSAGAMPLNYPLGVNDFPAIVGHAFDSAAFQDVPQFMFMGETDDNDAAQYDDAYSEAERELIFSVLGKTMMPTRWNYCTQQYQKMNANATTKIYPKVGHDITDEMRSDILAFIKERAN
jgi:dienelactone hydrolase